MRTPPTKQAAVPFPLYQYTYFRIPKSHRNHPQNKAHTGPHGIGQKSPDSFAIPLCARHHRTGNDSYHRLGPRKFCEKHNLDILAIVRRLNAKPKIRVEEGSFAMYLDDQRYVLGKIDAGIRPAIRKALQLCRENLSRAIAS